MSDRFTPIPDPRPADVVWPQALWPVADDVVLRGRTVELRRTVVDDAGGLALALAADAIWQFAVMAPLTESTWRERIEHLRASNLGFCQWTVVLREPVGDVPAGSIVGTTAYLETSADDAHTEIGSTSYDPRVWATRVNPECKLLLLGYAFDTLQMGRVQLKTDVRNIRSQQAIARLGAQFEGVLQRYQRRHDGTIRDTVLFSITSEQWPAVRAGLVTRLGGS
ncbi:MAG: GNAT family N-acetyltransferase [Actinomycetales bacterium]|nr:GNAT family N-acetyltransferase [Actinomycetales bacterium]